MPDTILDPQNPDATIQNRAPRPPGILPKNAQTWLIAGISVVMVAVIALSGGSGSKTAQSNATAPKTVPVIDPNAARIAEYRNRIEEQARRLAAEQAALAQTKQTFAGEAGPVPPMASAASIPPYTSAPAPTRVDERMAQRDQLATEKERREYQSLFASNVALTYRKDTKTETPPPSPSASPMQMSLPYIYPIPPSSPVSPTGPNQGAAPGATPSAPTPERAPQAVTSSEAGQPEPPPREPRKPVIDPGPTQGEGKQYRLFEGTIIETVLTNRLTGSLAGPVNCMVSTDVYSHERQQLLIPQGSRILGEVKQVSSFDQQRLAVVFHRLILPDGFSVSLDQFQGLNQIGETGLRDQVNRHYLQTFGVSIAIGTIAGLAQANTRSGFDVSSADAYRQGFATSLSQSALRILDRYLNILPTFTVREGHRIKIHLASDLLIPAYTGHKLSNDL